jgi:glycosyltransferase involved in cell wall biosynthesis
MKNFGLKGNYFDVPNVVNTEIFKVKTIDSNNKFILLHASSMVKIKNINGILRVVKQLESKISSFHFYFIGGNAKDFIPEATKMKIDIKNVSFINFIPQTELIQYFQKANAFVLFSQTENLPCVILESFSCGTPVISTDVGGISEYFPDNFGILIEPNNEEELLASILKIHSNYKIEKPNIMHQYAVNHFSKEKICEVFTNLYLKSLKE